MDPDCCGWCVQGEALLGQDKCGEAIRSLQESKRLYADAREYAEEYAKTKVSTLPVYLTLVP